MSDETKQVEEIQPTEEQPPSNSDAKKLPWVREMASELAELRREREERIAAEQQAAKEAEVKKLEDEKRWQEIIDMQKKELEETKTSFQKELFIRDIKASLLSAGFGNDYFINGAINNYSPDMGSIEEYVESLKNDESNQSFLAGARQDAPPITPPSVGKVTGKSFSKAQLDAMEHSDDPEQKQRWREYATEYYRKHGKFPE